MSTQVNTYVIAGVCLPYDEFFDAVAEYLKERYSCDSYTKDDAWDYVEKFRDSAFKDVQHHKGLCVVIDGACGEYVVIGRVLTRSDNGGHLHHSPTDFGSEMTELEKELILDAIETHFGIKEKKLKILVFSHYR